MSILLLGTFLDTVAAFAIRMMYTLGNTSQINRRGRLGILRVFNLGAIVPLPVTDRYADPTVKQSLLG